MNKFLLDRSTESSSRLSLGPGLGVSTWEPPQDSLAGAAADDEEEEEEEEAQYEESFLSMRRPRRQGRSFVFGVSKSEAYAPPSAEELAQDARERAGSGQRKGKGKGHGKDNGKGNGKAKGPAEPVASAPLTVLARGSMFPDGTKGVRCKQCGVLMEYEIVSDHECAEADKEVHRRAVAAAEESRGAGGAAAAGGPQEPVVIRDALDLSAGPQGAHSPMSGGDSPSLAASAALERFESAPTPLDGGAVEAGEAGSRPSAELRTEDVRHYFHLQSPAKTFYLYANSREELDRWLTALDVIGDEDVVSERAQSLRVGFAGAVAPGEGWDEEEEEEEEEEEGGEEEEEDEEEEERDVDEQEDDDEVFDLGSVAQQRRPGGLDTRASLSARNAM
jgi:hypothetical protein